MIDALTRTQTRTFPLVKLTKIYTRTGDDGTTGLVDGSRVSKVVPRMAAIGDVDEANSAIGVAITAMDEGEARAALIRIQHDLFDLGADIATPGDDFAPSDMVLRIVPGQIDRLERAKIDEDRYGDYREYYVGLVAAAMIAIAIAFTLRASVLRRLP